MTDDYSSFDDSATDDATTDDYSTDDYTYDDSTTTTDVLDTTLTYDSDADGIVDAIAYDSDGDAINDTVEFDTDGDGVTDTIEFDTDGDGLTDSAVAEDGQGGVIAYSDTDGDGIADTFAHDIDGDGIIDDSYSDVALTTTPFDPDSPDDPDDPDEPVQHDPNDPNAYDPDAVLDTSLLPDNGPFQSDDIPDADDDGVHGDPRGAMEYHQMQPGPVDCLPTSLAMTINEATGGDILANDVADYADSQGFMSANGMQPADAVEVFEHYGLEAEVTSGSVDDLKAALDSGDPIIVAIDSADIYNGMGGPFDDQVDAGHAVAITGIDDGPPAMVYINDPGFPDGAGLEIPLELFEDSWQDMDNQMVVATAPADGADAAGLASDGTDATTDNVDDGVLDNIQRIFLLPLTFTIDS